MSPKEPLDQDHEGLKSRPWNRHLTSILSLLAVGIFAGILYTGWNKYGNQVLHSGRFEIRKDKIQVTLPPDWIAGDIVDEVMRNGSLDEISLRDTEATVQIAQAFKLHPWIENVQLVSKDATGTVKVELSYRQLAGWVRVEGGHFAVDCTGILLPTNVNHDVSDQFAFIDVGNTYPDTPRPGYAWGDERVKGAAEIAGTFGLRWQELELLAIISGTTSRGTHRKQRPTFELRSKHGHRIFWGHAPEEETEVEALAAEKVDRLIDYVRTNGQLDQLDTAIQIDLRGRDTIRVSQQPLPPSEVAPR